MIKFDSDDLIYNRFDLIYKENVEKINIDDKYEVYIHVAENVAEINSWDKNYPEYILDKVTDYVFSKYDNVIWLTINKNAANYHDMLVEKNDIKIHIPDTVEELMGRLSRKHRYNTRRLVRLLNDQIGIVRTEHFAEKIPDEIVSMYFAWKKNTHGTDYHLNEQEYIRKFHVTDALVLYVNEAVVGVAFFCICNEVAYLENFSYDESYEKFSVGYLTYVFFLQKMVDSGIKIVYLGGGDYRYKHYFDAIETTVYEGKIYRDDVIEMVNQYLIKNSLKTIAIYGMGKIGQEFLKLKKRLNIDVAYGIDRADIAMDLLVKHPGDNINLNDVDAVIVTMESKNQHIINWLETKNVKILWWFDLIKDCYNNISTGEKSDGKN